MGHNRQSGIGVSMIKSNGVRENGFTMVELMVAVLVLAIGLLGLAGLQVWGLSNNHNAYLRTQATLLAQDIIERMRSNSGVDYTADCASFTATSVDCSANACTAGQMAGYDLSAWCMGQTTTGSGTTRTGGLANQLPSGTGTITKTAGPPIVYNITLSWIEQESTPNNPKIKHTVTKSFSTSFQP